jgi:hypothetical protein
MCDALIKVADELMDAGARYSTHPNPPNSFDCSLFTAYCLRKVGIYVMQKCRLRDAATSVEE